jgi:hypothetical protein
MDEKMELLCEFMKKKKYATIITIGDFNENCIIKKLRGI